MGWEEVPPRKGETGCEMEVPHLIRKDVIVVWKFGRMGCGKRRSG